jgi:hypothetical protein
MTTATILLNLDLAGGTTALVALGMIVVPNIDSISGLRRLVVRRLAQGAREPRGVHHADAAMSASPSWMERQGFA